MCYSHFECGLYSNFTLMRRVITCNCHTMHLADPAHSEHDTFSCWPLKNTTRDPDQPLYYEELYNVIFKIEVSFTYTDGQTYPPNRSFFRSEMAIFKQAARRKGVVPLLLPTSCNFIFYMEIFKSSPCQMKKYNLLVAVA